MTDVAERVGLALRRVLIDLAKEMDADHIALKLSGTNGPPDPNWADAPVTVQEKRLARAAIEAQAENT